MKTSHWLMGTMLLGIAGTALAAEPIASADIPPPATLAPPADPVAAALPTTEEDDLSIHSERGKPLVIPPRNTGKPRTPEPLKPRTLTDAPEAAAEPIESLEDSAYVGAPEILTETNGIRHVSGGIGKQERLYMKSLEPDFRLKLVFAAATGHFLSDVTVNILNSKGESVATVVTDGPQLLVDLPAGNYRINATYQEATLSKNVTVAATGLRTYPITFTGNVM